MEDTLNNDTFENINIPYLVLNSIWGKKPATSKQKAKMKKLGLSFTPNITRAEAFFMIGIFLKNNPS